MAFVHLQSFSASAYGFILIDGVFYDIVDDHAVVTYKMYDHSYYSGDIVIPEEITYGDKTYPVTVIGEYAFYTGSSITSVTLPNSITTIEDNAFCGCSGLSEITLPNQLTSIGNRAFSACTHF